MWKGDEATDSYLNNWPYYPDILVILGERNAIGTG